jgi:hypothetical protein
MIDNKIHPYDQPRWCGAKIMIDTNAINARQKISALNKIEQWKRDGVIMLVMAEPAYVEAQAGRNPAAPTRARKSFSAYPKTL